MSETEKLIENMDKREPEWFITYAKTEDLRYYSRQMLAGHSESANGWLRACTASWILACASRGVEARIMKWA